MSILCLIRYSKSIVFFVRGNFKDSIKAHKEGIKLESNNPYSKNAIEKIKKKQIKINSISKKQISLHLTTYYHLILQYSQLSL